MYTVQIIAQTVSIFAMAINILSYQNKKQKNIFLFQLIGSMLFAVSFFMLGAITGAILNFIGIVRALVFINKDKLRADRPIWLVLFTATFIGSYALTFTVFGKEASLFNLIVELLPVIGMIITTVSFQKKDARSVRAFGFVSSPLWLIYNVINFSLGAICCETVSLISITVGYVRFDMKKKKELEDESTES